MFVPVRLRQVEKACGQDEARALFFYESGDKCELLSAKGLTSAAFVIS